MKTGIMLVAAMLIGLGAASSQASSGRGPGELSLSEPSFNLHWDPDPKAQQAGNNAPQTITITNTSDAEITFKISSDFKPNRYWDLETEYHARAALSGSLIVPPQDMDMPSQPLVVSPGETVGLTAWANIRDGGTPAGLYSANLLISGNFSGSPLSIPVNWNVLKRRTRIAPPHATAQAVRFETPKTGTVWLRGSQQEFTYDPSGLPICPSLASSHYVGKIELWDYDNEYLVGYIDSCWHFVWDSVGTTADGASIPAGNYVLTLTVDHVPFYESLRGVSRVSSLRIAEPPALGGGFQGGSVQGGDEGGNR